MDTSVSHRTWLVLLPQLPPSRAYLRVKLQRRIQKLGAVALKGGVYVLPFGPESTAASEELRAELVEDRGDLIVMASVLCAGLTDATLAARFGARQAERQDGWVWVTRSGVFVDRIACAWLIKRFIDPRATFVFVDARKQRPPSAGERRFDMHPAEFTHEGDRCTFEVLLGRFSLNDAALHAIAEIVHDIDYQDEKFGRAETAGVVALMRGMCESEPDDMRRFERGAALLDALFTTLSA